MGEFSLRMGRNLDRASRLVIDLIVRSKASCTRWRKRQPLRQSLGRASQSLFNLLLELSVKSSSALEHAPPCSLTSKVGFISPGTNPSPPSLRVGLERRRRFSKQPYSQEPLQHLWQVPPVWSSCYAFHGSLHVDLPHWAFCPLMARFAALQC